MSNKNINGLLAIFFIILAMSFAFHESPTFSGSLAGHLFGIVGTALMFLTLVYPFKKRILGKRGRQNPLSTHIFYGLTGPSLVVIHSAHKFDSLIGLSTFLAMLIVVLSGITGRFLFRRVNRTLKDQQHELEVLKDVFQRRRKEALTCELFFDLEYVGKEDTADTSGIMEEEDRRADRCEQLVDIAHSISELEYSTTVFDSMKSMFSKWMRVHHVLTLFLFSFVILHILTMLYYGLRWLP